MTKPRNDRPLAKARRRLTRLAKHPPKPPAPILPGVAAARAKDWDQVTTYTVHFVNGKPYGPGVVRAHPDIVDTIRDQMVYRVRHRLDPVTSLPEPPVGPPNRILPIKPTGVGPGELVPPHAAAWHAVTDAELWTAMDQRERQPEPSDWGGQSPRCSHAGSGPCLQCGGFERSPSRVQTRRRSIFGESLA